MSRVDCISNRNIKIIASYVYGKLGTYHPLFEGLSYPADEYPSQEDFFLSEDEWTTYENYDCIFRKAKELVDEPNFYFNCGASSARLRSWGRFHYFARVFTTPDDGFERLPFFNRNLDDTKEIEVVLPPRYDNRLKKIRTILKIQFHSDFDPNRDYVGDPYLRGIISSIPTLWGMAPAIILQPINSYDPEILLNKEPEFAPYQLDVKIEGDYLTLLDPVHGQRRTVGERVLLLPEIVNGQEVFLGKHTKRGYDLSPKAPDKKEGILITETVGTDKQVLLRKGEIFMAPYFILDVSYERLSFWRRIFQIFKIKGDGADSGSEMIETINQLRRSIKTKNEAYLALEKTNTELREAKARLDQYSSELERKVEERTSELHKAQQDLLKLNRNLESKVKAQIDQLEKYNELRRYLSPKLTEKILAGDHVFGAQSQRKLMTVVFTDIRGFSAITDSLEPEEISHLLDRYLSEMINIVHRYDGTLNKILGDGLLIFFGDPTPMEDHAERAVRMAIDMQKKARELAPEWREYGHELGLGIGINTGFMTAGNIGPDIHKDYTVIGNQVNIAARLESAARAGQILISQRTFSRVKGLVEVEEVGTISVKGIHSPVKTYNVIW